MYDICGIDQKSIDDGKVWVRIRGTNPTVQKPVSEILYKVVIFNCCMPLVIKKMVRLPASAK